jgi:hypothetical protein
MVASGSAIVAAAMAAMLRPSPDRGIAGSGGFRRRTGNERKS